MKYVFQVKLWERMAHLGGRTRMAWLPVLVVSGWSPCALAQEVQQELFPGLCPTAAVTLQACLCSRDMEE